LKKTGKYYSWAILAIIWLIPFIGSGQEALLTATVDKNPVSINDIFTLKLSLTNGKGNIETPDLSDFRVVFGPSRSSSYRIVNGMQSSSVSVSYTLRPKKLGTYEIGVAKAQVDGKVLTTKPIKMEVVKGGSTNTTQSSSNSSNSSRGTNQRTQTNKNLMVRLELSKRNVYKGEQIVASYVLLSRYNNIDLGDMDFPTLDGFWVEEFPEEQTSWEPNLEVINGVQYRKAIIKRQVLFPQRSGSIELSPFVLSANVNRSFFNPGENITVRSNSPTITVKELPAGAPDSFKGAVGNFEFTASVDKKKLKANDAINLKVTISGNGNLRLINVPPFAFPDDFEVYDPETNDRIKVTTGGIKGSRNFQYLIIPRYPGKYTIPQLEFSFFNPSSGKYESTTAGPFDFSITDDGGAVPSAGISRPKNVVEESGLDIRYIITDKNLLTATRSQFFRTSLFWIGSVGPFALLLLFLGYRRRKEALDSDVTGKKRREAKKMARKSLKAADEALKGNDSSVFYQEISKALYGYISGKLSIPIGKLSRNSILEELKKNNIDESTINDATYVIDTCEMARFAPVTDVSNEMFYKRTAELIENLEDKLK